MGHPPPSRRHAVVLGGSLAGIAVARVLADWYERVTLIERDSYPNLPVPRRGTPQSRHVHVLLEEGRRTLEELFPGFSHDLENEGAIRLDSTNDVPWLTPEGWAIRFPSDLSTFGVTRDRIDLVVRRHLEIWKNVKVITEAEARELIVVPSRHASSDRTVVGVRYRAEGHGDLLSLPADLVVDTTGRVSHFPQWLEGMGLQAPEEEIVNPRLGYATRLYERSASNADWKGIYVQAAPPRRNRLGVLFPVEKDRWIVTLGGGGGDYPPGDEKGFLEFARSLPCRAFSDVLTESRPVGNIELYRQMQSRLRHCEKLAHWPRGFVAMGDAVCAFNPVYGQGMTAAAEGARLLGRTLSEAPPHFERVFQKRLADFLATPWLLATSEDFRFPGTIASKRALRQKSRALLAHKYLDRLFLVTTKDASVRLAFMEVFHLLRHPATLLHPRVALRVLGAFGKAAQSENDGAPQTLAKVVPLHGTLDESVPLRRTGST